MNSNSITGTVIFPKVRTQKHREYYALVNRGDYSVALQALKKIVENDPKDIEALSLAFKASSALRNWDDALHFNLLLCALKPGADVYKREQAITLSNAGRHSEALQLGASLLKGNRDIQMLDLLKVCHFNLGEFRLAFEYGQIALCEKDRVAVSDKDCESNIAHLPTNGKINVVSFSLWGDNESYQYGAMVNSLLVRYLYPTWVARFYVGEGVSDKTIAFLKASGSQVILANEKHSHIPGYFWRFMVMVDKTVDKFLCRDCDCRLSVDEAFLVNEWLASGKKFHVIRDHILHNDLILAGLWGGTAIETFDLEREIASYFGGVISNDYHRDQVFLGKVIWPLIRGQSLVHDSNYRLHGVVTNDIKSIRNQPIGTGYMAKENIANEVKRFNMPILS